MQALTVDRPLYLRNKLYANVEKKEKKKTNHTLRLTITKKNKISIGE